VDEGRSGSGWLGAVSMLCYDKSIYLFLRCMYLKRREDNEIAEINWNGTERKE
jgi:hypothetical protein